ncbi:MAG: hypothetical protein GTN70_10105 [Deltaproteobacteria bacterium]|nr:hypothetical protein [Deltaproteobacteria bacterium]NIS78169.1 hypothetical protein [Deltaproteobacteria bacterium]
MDIKDSGINIYAGPGRYFFEFHLAQRSFPGRQPGEKAYVRRLSPESGPEEALLFAMTVDLFLPGKILIFPDYDTLRRELKDAVTELARRKDDLGATVIVPVKNRSKLAPALAEHVRIVDVSETGAKKAAIGYVGETFAEHGIAVENDVVELLTLSSADDPHSLISEVGKLALAFSETKKATVADLKEFSAAKTELEIFHILREVIRGNAPKGISHFYRYIKTVEEGDILRVLGALKWSLKKEFERARGKEKRDRLLRLIFLAGSADVQVKGESRLPPRDNLQNMLVYMADIMGV